MDRWPISLIIYELFIEYELLLKLLILFLKDLNVFFVNRIHLSSVVMVPLILHITGVLRYHHIFVAIWFLH